MTYIEEIVSELKKEIVLRKSKLIYMKFKTFLAKFGYKRRNKQLITQIDDCLQQEGIEVFCSRDEGWTWYDLSPKDNITFRLKGDLNMHISKQSINPNAGVIEVSNGTSPISLYPHQIDALQSLDNQMNRTKDSYEGLFVIPTGGGKTLTAVHWLLRNVIDRHIKVLWIAHRHELLDQAFQTVEKNAYSNLLKNRSHFRYRILSGIHDRPVNIQNDDDFIIASKDSINHGIEHVINNWLKDEGNEVFLVIDEAHHATAKTYRKVIDNLKNNVKRFRMLGLTATPFRTSKHEEGLLKKIFKDDITYKIDLKTLIHRGILSQPIFEELNTDLDMTNQLTDRDIQNIQAFDQLPEDVAKYIAESKERNNKIVDQYVQNTEKYGQLLVFALDIHHAITLNALFKQKGIASDFVVSNIRDAITGITISTQENKEKISKFKERKLEVLINVNILTEGTDLPNVQTVFLTRPTISSILMTQMIGRALRGTKAGGTEKAYIVSFVDQWKDKFVWVNPEKLYIEDNVDFKDITSENVKQLVRLISIEKLEEFAEMMDDSIDTTDLEALNFLQRVPVGLYSFTILIYTLDEESVSKNCEVLVYDHIQQAYQMFIYELDEIFRNAGYKDLEFLNEQQLNILCGMVKREYFEGNDMLPAFNDQDIKDILSYYALKGTEPAFLKFEDRNKFDLSKVARYIYDQSLGGRAKQEYLDSLWEDEKSFWKVFFGNKKLYFRKQLDNEILKIEEPDIYKEVRNDPQNKPDLVNYEKMTLYAISQIDPKYCKMLKDQVFAKSKDSKGLYTCAKSGVKSDKRIYFQIDHIKPMSEGGLTELSNLQLLTRKENGRKGNSYTITG